MLSESGAFQQSSKSLRSNFKTIIDRHYNILTDSIDLTYGRQVPGPGPINIGISLEPWQVVRPLRTILLWIWINLIIGSGAVCTLMGWAFWEELNWSKCGTSAMFFFPCSYPLRSVTTFEHLILTLKRSKLKSIVNCNKEMIYINRSYLYLEWALCWCYFGRTQWTYLTIEGFISVGNY